MLCWELIVEALLKKRFFDKEEEEEKEEKKIWGRAKDVDLIYP